MKIAITVPIRNFLKLDLTEIDNEYYNLECIIEGMDNIEYHPFTNDLSPFNRLSMSDDITSLEIEFMDGTIKLIQLVWEGTDTTNYCQISYMISWNKISINIDKENTIKKMKEQCANKADKICLLYTSPSPRD